MRAPLHFKHSEGKRISLHYCVTDLISSGKLFLLNLSDQANGGIWEQCGHCFIVLVTTVHSDEIKQIKVAAKPFLSTVRWFDERLQSSEVILYGKQE